MTKEFEKKVPSKSLNESRCVLCKGRNLACGRTSCPILARLYSSQKVQHLVQTTDLDGSSPPSLFVGRMGYPKVLAGPMMPPFKGDTSLFDETERWFGREMEEIIDYRQQLIRGMYRVDATDQEGGGKLLDRTIEIALADHSVDAEFILQKLPHQTIVLDSELPPMGPSAPMTKFSIGTLKTNHALEKTHGDTDLKAQDALIRLYERYNLPESQLMRAFSAGLLGLKKKRKLVPTRWSITATDSILGLHYLESIRTFPWINEFRVYESTFLDNRFMIMMMPKSWAYECIEAFWPGSTWNMGKRIGIVGDWEGFYNRTTYASIGGCYYAARLMTAEALMREGRQAAVLILREAYPGKNTPTGVWQVRETVRDALSNPYKKFDTKKEAVKVVMDRLKIGEDVWRDTSRLLHMMQFQTSLDQFLSPKEGHEDPSISA